MCDENDNSCKATGVTQSLSWTLGLEPDDGHSTIKLTNYALGKGPYITLSRCWGTTRPMVTTNKSNYQELVDGMLETSLPKTFLDAVHIARGLGIRYLWIDSLCIIQDDLAGWEIESTKMADVYSGSFLAIAATRSVDCDGGCFSERQTEGGVKTNTSLRPLETFKIEGCNQWLPFQISVREALSISHQDACYPPLGSRTAAAFHRAWCFQERLLSARVLHFHLDEMVW